MTAPAKEQHRGWTQIGQKECMDLLSRNSWLRQFRANGVAYRLAHNGIQFCFCGSDGICWFDPQITVNK